MNVKMPTLVIMSFWIMISISVQERKSDFDNS